MHDDDHPTGRLLSRREALKVLGAIGIVPLVGGGEVGAARRLHVATPRFPGGTGSMCVVRPAQILGPYYVDVMLDRSDIRTNPPRSEPVPGVPLELKVQVSRIEDGACGPFAGAVVDLWQCDAHGIYSGVNDPNFDTLGERWLRGYQIADAEGRVQFTTIYPGWYPGRTAHLHFKVRTSLGDDASEFVSQLYFDDEVTDRVYGESPYSGRPDRGTRNANDTFFRSSGGSELLLEMEETDAGFRTWFDIGLQL